MKRKPLLFSVGHSNRSFQALLMLLRSTHISHVIDCRTRPYSRFRQFNQPVLDKLLRSEDIAYEYHGRNIGGLEENERFSETLDELVKRAINGDRLALMCSEGDYAKCHRGTILTPELEQRGATVVHLVYETVPQP